MSVVETVLVYVAIPLAIYGVVALLTLRDKVAKAPRYRPGQAWEYPPVWWAGHPEGVGSEHPESDTAKTRQTAKGGARGSW